MSNDSNKKKLFENVKISISASENEEKPILSNVDISDTDKEQKSKVNSHLIYLKSDNKKNIFKKKYVDSSNSDVSFQDNKKETNRALIKKYESKLEKLTNQIEDYKKKYLEERQTNLDLVQELKYMKLEKEKISKINNIEIEKTNEKNISLEEQNKKLIIKNEDLQKKLDENSPKIWQYDDINEKYQKLLKEHKNLFETNQTLNELFNENKNKKNEIDSDYQNLKLENQVLQQNNEILKKNLAVDEDKIKELNEKISELENDIRDIRRINQNYIEKLTDKNLNIDNTYKDKVNKEIDNMRNRYESDIYNLKKHYDDINEKKTSYLKEERDEYKAKCNKYEKILKERDESLNLVQNELRNLNSKTTEQITYLKLQLNTKTEELNSRIAIYEEQISALTLFKNENEALKEKNDFLRSEMIKIQADHKAEIAEYKIRINVLEEKLKNYDNMENELDNVINNAPGEGDIDDKEIIDIIKDVPTSNKRRINQCLTLANKVKMLSNENEKLKLINDKINNELQKMNDQCNIYKNIVDQVKQPNSYLITNLKDKEMEIYRLKQDILEKDQENNKLRIECDSYKETINKMENDIKTLVNNRKKIDDLNYVLTNYINNEKNGNNNYNNIKEITDYANNFNINLNNSINPYSNQKNSFSLTASSGFRRPKPERDININEQNEILETPEWYKKLKKIN